MGSGTNKEGSQMGRTIMVLQRDRVEDRTWRNIWKNLMPYRIEIFCWQVLHERVAVKQELAKKNLIDQEAAVCGLFKNESELVRHLFFHCLEVWHVWMRWCSEWGVTWVVLEDLVISFNTWNAGPVRKGEFKIWCMAFYAILWSVWLYRNDMVFRRATWNADQVFELVKLKVATWAQAKWPFEYGVVLDTFRYPAEGTMVKKRKITRIVEEWSKPHKG
ncbi:Uncharacterized protein TCM_028962 [Theobroma cacao]|uniref:Reverse transcriptase zinc-binding domain-containing protein n=1 Tax=Theobroma cacao TaxID=3641 RepID=A0A061GBP9_THECC|nr:Uncharacterized protein TCM_028962 [Theobroma cacao]